MSKFIIEGGIPLGGKVKINGAKNAAIKMIVASLLTDEEVILENVPRIEDVEVDLRIVSSLGVKTEWVDGHTLRLQDGQVASTEVPKELSSSTRAAILLMSPLLARRGEFTLYNPGGCMIGNRPIDRHIEALRAMGAVIEEGEAEACIGRINGRLQGAIISFKKPTVMGTENVILAAVLAEGKTVIENSAQEPEIDDLITLLVKMEARVGRGKTDPSVIEVEGVERLSGARHKILPDRNEAATFAIAAAVTGGDVTIQDSRPLHMSAFLAKLKETGVPFEITDSMLTVLGSEIQGINPLKIETKPHPGFMTDWQQPFAVLLSQARGESLIHETIYEDRFGYFRELAKMGLAYELLTDSQMGQQFNPEGYNFDWKGAGEPKTWAKISAPVKLSGAQVEVSDLRAGATLVLAGLAAEGQTEVLNAEVIDRGYESLESRLAALGAKIERVE